MQSSKKRALSVLSMAIAATMGAKAAHGAVLTLYYDNINDIQDFNGPSSTVVQTYGYAAGNTNGGVYSGPTTINIAIGDTLQFGIDAVVTNNINTDAGKTTGTSTKKGSNAVQPSFLGLATFSTVVPSSDTSASILTPNTQGSPTGTFAGAPDFDGTAHLNNSAGVGDQVPANNGIGAVPLWSNSTQGDVSPTSATGGDVGDHFASFQGNGAILSQTPAGVNTIAQYGAATATYANATDFFSQLSYTALKTGTVTLNPQVDAGGTSYWTNTATGSATVVSGYISQEFDLPGDVIGTLPVLVINVTGSVTPPTNHPILSLTAAAPASGYGSSVGTLHVTGSHGSYSVAQESNTPTATGFVEASGFNPGTDEEIFAVDVLVGGTQANAGEIATLVTAIDGDGVVGTSGINAAATYAGLGVTHDTSPFGSQYNLFLDIPNGGTGDNFLGLDLSNGNDSNLSGFTFSAIATVPEPMSLGLLALGGLGLMGRRSRRKA